MQIGGIGKPGGLPRAGWSSLYQNAGTRESKLPLAGAGFGGQDQLTLSLSYLEEQTQRAWELSALEQQEMESSGDSAALDALEEAMDILEACSKIAASIMKGDQVPLEDLRYLMDHDPQGYQLAMAMRRPKEDPEKCKSVLSEEDQQASEKASVEAPAEGGSAGGEVTGAAPSGESAPSGEGAFGGQPEG
ncbi:MAG: hypothetical protein ACOYJZ_07540 [Acutalibacter sp.]|jgi:hypothetical protein